MGNIPNAEPSPRVVNGVLKWYEGDTWELDLTLELEDEYQAPIVIAPGDTVNIVFRDRSCSAVKTYSFTNITGNTVTVEMDAETTALFPKGFYTYDVTYSGEHRTTFANDNKAVVE